MSSFLRSIRRVSFCLALVALVACDDPVQVGGASPNGGRRRGPRAGAGAGAPGADAGVDAAVDSGALAYVDNDFVEVGVANRDPFRDFVLSAALEGPVGEILEVKLRNVALDQMRLIAVITGVPVPYAMIVDPDGVGHVVVRGDYIGRQELVNVGGAEGLPIALYWRIDRIRDGEVVLTRADPLNPNQPPLMRSMALRDVNAETSDGVRRGAIGNTGEGATGDDATDAPAPTPGAIVPPASRPRSSSTPNTARAPAADGAQSTSSGPTGYPSTGSQTAPAPSTTTRPPSIFGSGISH